MTGVQTCALPICIQVMDDLEERRLRLRSLHKGNLQEYAETVEITEEDDDNE